jgi:hypothetical protein
LLRPDRRNNEQRKHKELWTDQEMGPSVRVWSCEDERHEARKIAEDISWLMQEGRAGGDIAIFYRVNAMTRALEDALRDAKIPYQIARGVEFYARKEIKDMLAYLRVVANPAGRMPRSEAMRPTSTPRTRGRSRRSATGQAGRASPGARSPVAAETDHWSVRPKVLLMERDHSRPGSFGKVKRQNSYGKNFREAQTLNLQNRRSELKALFQVQQTIVHGGQEWRARPGSQSGSAQLRRKSQA